MNDNEHSFDELTAAGAFPTVDDEGCVVGFAGHWRLTRNGRRGYWEAKPISGWGLPLAHAIALHEQAMPGGAWGLHPAIAGAVIRVDGSAGAPHPAQWARSCNGDGTVTRYHIDTVGGLRVFCDYVKRPGLAEATIASACPYRMVDV